MTKRFIPFLLALLATIFIGAGVVTASDTNHTLIVDGQQYQSYKEAGGSIQWNTPDTNPTAASFPERGQTWTGNGSGNLPCQYGIHWVSNDNVLTISHCLDAPNETITTTVSSTTVQDTVPQSSTTVQDTTTTAPTTTVADSTTTTVADSTTTTAVAATGTTEAPTTTVAVVPFVFASDVGTPVAPVQLPRTGFPFGMFLVAACAITGFGVILNTLRKPAKN